jgi:hypothetical protein
MTHQSDSTPEPTAGQAPPPGDWGIDTSAGRPILVYKNCSVIEADDAQYVLGLIEADRARFIEPTPPRVRDPGSDPVSDLREAVAFLDQARASKDETVATGVMKDAREWLESAARRLLERPEGGTLEENVRALLDGCPYTVRSREGGGPESLAASLAITFLGMQRDVTEARRHPPAVPTQAMCTAGQEKAREWPTFPLRISAIYRAMVEAAPPPSRPGPPKGWDAFEHVIEPFMLKFGRDTEFLKKMRSQSHLGYRVIGDYTGALEQALTRWVASVPTAPFAGLMDGSRMKSAFRTTEVEGGKFSMVFKFRSLEDLDAADDEWLALAGGGPAARAPSSPDRLQSEEETLQRLNKTLGLSENADATIAMSMADVRIRRLTPPPDGNLPSDAQVLARVEQHRLPATSLENVRDVRAALATFGKEGP